MKSGVRSQGSSFSGFFRLPVFSDSRLFPDFLKQAEEIGGEEEPPSVAPFFPDFLRQPGEVGSQKFGEFDSTTPGNQIKSGGSDLRVPRFRFF